MPSYSFVKQDLLCPSCNEVIADYAAFVWGFCPAASWLQTYEVGDAIRWHTCMDGSIIPWAYFKSYHYTAGNMGDPQYLNLLVFEDYKYVPNDQDPMPEDMRCPTCRHAFAGTAVKIMDGHIKQVWIYQQTTSETDSYYYLLNSMGQMTKSMKEWLDYPTGRSDC